MHRTVEDMTNTTSSSIDIRPFRVEVAQAELDDLMDRLARTRLPQPAPGRRLGLRHAERLPARRRRAVAHRLRLARRGGAHQRVPALHDRDRRAADPLHPRALAARRSDAAPPRAHLPRVIRRLPRHDRRARRPGRARRPRRGRLRRRDPGCPGLRLLEPRRRAGWTTARVARAYDALMRRLGYAEYGIHGSDNGALVARELGLLNPEGFLGLHVLQLFSFPSGDPSEFERLEPQDYAGLEHMQWFQSVGGYNTMNATRPQTVAVGPQRLAGRACSPTASCSTRSATARRSFRSRRSSPRSRVNWFANAAAGMSRSYLENARAEAEPQVNAAPHRRRRLQGRLPDDQGLRRARQLEHRALEPIRGGRALRGARGARPSSSATSARSSRAVRG